MPLKILNPLIFARLLAMKVFLMRSVFTPTFLAPVLLGIGSLASPAVAERPNVVVMMVDDLGFSDVGCYGGEIDTPNLDALAKNGVRFSQFYNTAKCHSSRVCLLTGQYCMAAGDTSLSNAVTSAEVLGNAGYFTAMTGKWHLKRQPTDFGFQRYFGHLSGACNYFSGDNTFRLNGQPWQVPDDQFYTTVANVDYGLEFLSEARQSGKPWYLYVAFNAPHAPLHALPQDYEKYKGKYDQGWDAIRDARIAKQKRLGVLPKTLEPSPRPEHVPAWDDLKPWMRDYEAKRMSTLAAMIDRVDQEVGRLIDDLKENDELDNTLILFVSDNGACPYDRRQPRLDITPTNAQDSYGDSTGWAWARNSPFRYYKQNQFEGGISTPAIVHWPDGLRLKNGAIVDQPAHLIDVLPTLADVTGSERPTAWEGRDLRPMSGISLKPLLQGKQLASRPPIHLLFSADRGLRDGDWKLVSFQSAAWELYNVAKDRCELNNLAATETERLSNMIAAWEDIAENVLHAPSKARAPVNDLPLPHRHREWTNFGASSPQDYVGRKKSNAKEAPPRNSSRTLKIRARKNTELQVVGNELRLQFSGDDPGIALDLRGRPLTDGPYRLAFQLKSDVETKGEVFFTSDPRTILPKGQKVSFDVQSSRDWQEVAIEIQPASRVYQIRVDIGDGPGKATIAELRLLGDDGHVLLSWPNTKRGSNPK